MKGFFNKLFSSLTVFVVIFAWMLYTTKSKFIASVLSATASISACLLMFTLGKKSDEKRRKTKEKKSLVRDFESYVTYCPDSLELFADMLAFSGFAVKKLTDKFAEAQKNGKKSLVAVSYTVEKPSANDLCQIAVASKKYGYDNVMLFCNHEITLPNCPVEIKTYLPESTVAQFCASAKLPPLVRSHKIKKRILPSYALNKKRFGWYVTGSLFLALSSFVSFYPVYTLTWASIMLILAFYSLTNRKYNAVAPSKSL